MGLLGSILNGAGARRGGARYRTSPFGFGGGYGRRPTSFGRRASTGGGLLSSPLARMALGAGAAYAARRYMAGRNASAYSGSPPPVSGTPGSSGSSGTF